MRLHSGTVTNHCHERKGSQDLPSRDVDVQGFSRPLPLSGTRNKATRCKFLVETNARFVEVHHQWLFPWRDMSVQKVTPFPDCSCLKNAQIVSGGSKMAAGKWFQPALSELAAGPKLGPYFGHRFGAGGPPICGPNCDQFEAPGAPIVHEFEALI